MDRRAKILHAVKRDGLGLEIGPSHAPIAPKREGFRVHVLDHLDQEGLRRKYAEHPVDIECIEEVDFIWDGRPYSEVIGQTKLYDWVIASHVVEHAPDLIGFLKECELLLKEDGALSLAVPDKRYCFDALRPISGLARIVDSHYSAAKIHSPGTVCEYYMNVISRNGRIAWDEDEQGGFEFIHGKEEALLRLKQLITSQEYLDLHAWCFVPSSFRLIVNDLYELGFIRLRERAFFTTSGSEFYIALSLDGSGPDCSRMELASAVEAELRYP